jgi:hypothetical protein
LVGLAVLAGRPSGAWAAYPDVFGWGPAVQAQAGAGVATSRDFAAAFVNPAGLAFATRSSLYAGMTYTASLLQVNGQAAGIPDPWALDLGLVLRAPGHHWLAEHVALGLATHVLPDTLLHLDARAPGEPVFPYYQNRTQRLVVMPALALRLHPALALGVSLNVLAGLTGPATAREGATRELETSLREEMGARASVVLGLRVEPTRWLSLGLVYRQRFAVPYAVVSSNQLAGLPLDLAVRAESFYTPDELVLGSAWTLGRFRVLADLAWARWSAWAGPFVAVGANSTGFSLAPVVPDPGYHDTWALRVGGTWQPRLASGRALELRAGLGFETALVGEQTGRSNLFDHDRWVVGLGASLELPSILDLRWRLAIAGQLHVLATRTFTKVVGTTQEAAHDPNVLADEDAGRPGFQTSNPGYPSISGGGAVLTLSAGLEVDL